MNNLYQRAKRSGHAILGFIRSGSEIELTPSEVVDEAAVADYNAVALPVHTWRLSRGHFDMPHADLLSAGA